MPTTQAMRAARAVFAERWALPPEDFTEQALVIDRETRLPALLGALRAFLQASADLGSECPLIFDVPELLARAALQDADKT